MLGAAKARLYRRLATAVKATAAAIIVVVGSYQALFGSPWAAPALGELRALLSLTFDGGSQFRVSWGPAAPEAGTALATQDVARPRVTAAIAQPAALAAAAPTTASPPATAAPPSDAAQDAPRRQALALCALAGRGAGQGSEIVSRATLHGTFGGVIDGYGVRDPSLIRASADADAAGYALPLLASIRSQGGLAGFTPEPAPAQAGLERLPNTANAVSPGAGTFALGLAHDSLDVLDVGRGSFVAELNPWYHSLNAGMRANIVGGLRCDATEGVEAATPTLASLGAPPASVRQRFDARNLYVSDGRSALAAFTVAGKSPDRRSGAEVKLEAPGVVRIDATLAAELKAASAAPVASGWDIERARYGSTRSVMVEIVVNGRVAASKPVPADGTLQNLTFSIPIERSSWVALRLMGAGHSNPVFVLVDNKPVRASRTSVEWSQRALLQAFDAESSRWSPDDAPVAAAAFQYAYEIYGGILKETETP